MWLPEPAEGTAHAGRAASAALRAPASLRAASHAELGPRGLSGSRRPSLQLLSNSPHTFPFLKVAHQAAVCPGLPAPERAFCVVVVLVDGTLPFFF